MAIDPAFDTPFADYGQTGSYVAPVAVPSAGPLDGTLVGLPCLNPDWLRLVLGSTDQLRNRSSWLASYTDAQIVAILGQVEQLRIALQMANPCCDVVLSLEADCVLRYSTDGGVTFTDVAGWAANFAECVKQAIIPPPPLLPPGSDNATRACNIATYLAQDIIHEAITQAINAYDHDLSLLALAGNIAAATFAFELPWTAAFIYAAYDLYAYFTAGNIADLRTSEADSALWSLVTCAIYNAIKADGAITAGNCAAVISALCAISYAHPVAITAICTYVTQLGCDQLRALQVVGALAVGDCSGCGGTWCEQFDFRVGQFGWAPIAGGGSWVSGVGFEADGAGPINLVVDLVPASPINIDYVQVWWCSNVTNGSQGRAFYYHTGAGYTSPLSLFGAAEPGGVFQDASFGPVVVDSVRVVINSDGSGPPDTTCLLRVRLAGPGVNPFGANNCA